MVSIVAGKTHRLPDVRRFLAMLDSLDHQPILQGSPLFANDREIVVARAPGRLDVMGGIADYSGALVLQLPIREATLVAVQPRTDHLLKICTLGDTEPGRQQYLDLPLDQMARFADYREAQLFFQQSESIRWAAYVAGAFLVLEKEKGMRFDRGANILIRSDVPEGKGVSSSAALEVAAMTAIAHAFGIPMQPVELALLCQKVENLVAGAPCGIMDQMSVLFGQDNKLLALLCRPAALQPFLDIPEQISFWGIDSGIRHAVSGSDYTSVRVGAFMGQRIITALAPRHNSGGAISPYLSELTPERYERDFAALLPERLKGSDFIEKFRQTIDEVTTIDPEFIYSIRKPAEHPIYEHARVQEFAELLQKPLSEESCRRLGALMYQSHQSYSACGLGSAGTDRLVALAQEIGPAQGVYGAKITGGGSGGTVAVLAKRQAGDMIERIATLYADETGYRPLIFSGSSMGALAFGHLLVQISTSPPR